MKFCTLSVAALLCAPVVQGFAVISSSTSSRSAPSMQLRASLEEEALEKEALAATKKYGATSKEARVLWDAVEEMRAAESHTKTPMGGLDTECGIEEEAAAACQEYDAKIAEMQKVITEHPEYSEGLGKMKTLTKDLTELKINVQKTEKKIDPVKQAALTQAIAEARKASAEFGATSSQAALAWETVEDIAASGLEAAMEPTLDAECVVEQATTAEACETMEELNKVLAQEEKK